MYPGGPSTGSNSGVYPDPVLSEYYYFGIYGGPDTAFVTVTGLNPAQLANITLFASSSFGGGDNGTTVYNAGNQTLSLNVTNNTQNTVTFSNLQPAPDGTIKIKMYKAAGTSIGYLNAIVVNIPYDDGSIPVAPEAVKADYVSGQGVQLTWKDKAYNETGFEIYRSTSAAGPFTTPIKTIALPNVTTAIDSTATGNTQYYYAVKAINLVNKSILSNIASIVTPNRVPQIAPIASVSLKSNQTLSINISATDDATDNITFIAEGLPAFATLVNNGNGTGVINIVPNSASVGTYNNIIITAKDNSDSSRSTSFSITVVDKDVSSVYVNFSDGFTLGGQPWNNITTWPSAGAAVNNLVDDSNVPAGMTMTYLDGFAGVVNYGMHPGNGQTVYPEVVMRSAIYESSTTAKRIRISGLSTSKRYNFVFFNSLEFGLNNTTNFTVAGATGSTGTVSLNGAYNINKTVQVNGIIPDASGQVVITVQKASGADYAYLSTMVIQSYASGLDLLSPVDLRVIDTKANSVKLQWADRAYGETGYQVWRSVGSGSFTQLSGTLAANTTSYTDNTVSANTKYTYIVRAMKSTTPSSYSPPATTLTNAYTIYANFNSDPLDIAGAPWNNTNAAPVAGSSWDNLSDDSGQPTSVGMGIIDRFSEMQPLGMNTGNQSGVFPDEVLRKSYFVFPGITAKMKLTGLNLTMKYNLTLFGSTLVYGDANSRYIINGKNYYLNSSLNIGNGTVTIYDISPDENGEIIFSIERESTNSFGGYLSGLILSGYTPYTGSNPVAPLALARGVTEQGTQVAQAGGDSDIATPLAARTPEEVKPIVIGAYPNPFKKSLTVTVPVENDDKVQVSIFNVKGEQVYSRQFNNLTRGNNYLSIDLANKELAKGVYIVRVLYTNKHIEKTIKLIKE